MLITDLIHLVNAEERWNSDFPLIAVEERDLPQRSDRRKMLVHAAILLHDASVLRLIEHALVPKLNSANTALTSQYVPAAFECVFPARLVPSVTV